MSSYIERVRTCLSKLVEKALEQICCELGQSEEIIIVAAQRNSLIQHEALEALLDRADRFGPKGGELTPADRVQTQTASVSTLTKS